MVKRIITIRNKAGIHCRPSGVILHTIQQEFPDHEIFLQTPDGAENPVDSILTLISLGLSCGKSCVLTVSGAEEERALKRIGDLFEFEFDFPPR
ncbi:MAG: HPr family phosphocarrier protein [Victivallaceae bacterium]|nr:HPr family phosphocarrier protein [Victivallaceae bacterium]